MDVTSDEYSVPGLIMSHLQTLFWPIFNPVGAIVEGLLLPFLALAFDRSSPPTIKPLLFLVAIEYKVRDTYGQPNAQIFGAIIGELAWALASYCVGWAVGLNQFFAVYFGLGLLERTAAYTVHIYLYLDGPMKDIAGEWRFWLVRLTAHALFCVILYEPRGTWTYLTRHADECDVLSTCLLLPALLLLSLWAFGLKNVPDYVFRLSDWLKRIQDRGLVYRLQYLRRRRTQYRGLHDAMHMEKIKFHERPLYTHQPLEPGHIRLLLIKPRPILSGFLETRLISCSLEDAKALGYEALSYTWQGEQSSHPILVDDQRYYITPNLYSLLLARRQCLKNLNRLVWADAICINQQDNTVEKPAQLLLMKEVYVNASRVIGWLGDDWNSALAAEMIINIEMTWQMFHQDGMNFFNNWIWITDGPRWQAMVQVVQNSYFSRAWICQEMVLGAKLQFYLGGQYIPWSTFRNVILLIMQPGTSALLQEQGSGLSAQAKDSFYIANTVMVCCLRDFGYATEYPLAILLSMFARLEAGTPRDKIYALLGLSNTALAQSILPDYVANQCTVFTDLAILLLRSRDDAAAVLPHAGIGYPGFPEEQPSWAPDWFVESKKHSASLAWNMPRDTLLSDPGFLEERGMTLNVPRYTAARHSESYFYISSGRRFLYFRAVVLDPIATTSTPFPTDRDMILRRTWYDGVKRTFDHSSHASPPSVQSNEEVFWRTLIADRTQDLFPAPAVWQHYHSIFVESMTLWPLQLSGNRLAYWEERVDPNFRPGRQDLGAAYPVLGAALAYSTQLATACQGRSFCTTSIGRIGLVPPKTCAADLTPFILRSHPEQPGTFLLVGECYIHGMMSGEMMDAEFDPQWFKVA
ncbi:hypothetical protein LTR17_010896 [Elasticomyces elasticus]|nr:hypothetical protein LTR17_010896 [Elasticomyces elasticus]